jgi:hypothetical protein
LFCLKVCVLVFFCRLSTVPFPPSHFIFLILVAHILRLADYFDCIDLHPLRKASSPLTLELPAMPPPPF